METTPKESIRYSTFVFYGSYYAQINIFIYRKKYRDDCIDDGIRLIIWWITDDMDGYQSYPSIDSYSQLAFQKQLSSKSKSMQLARWNHAQVIQWWMKESTQLKDVLKMSKDIGMTSSPELYFVKGNETTSSKQPWKLLWMMTFTSWQSRTMLI